MQVDNAVGNDDFENPPLKNGAIMHDEVGKKKEARKNLKKGATAQAVEGSSGQAKEGAIAQAEEDTHEGLESFDMTLNDWVSIKLRLHLQ